MLAKASSRSSSETPVVWSKRATASRTWLASVRGSLRCLGNAKTLSGRSLRSVSVPCFSCGFQVACIVASKLCDLPPSSINPPASARFRRRRERHHPRASSAAPLALELVVRAVLVHAIDGTSFRARRDRRFGAGQAPAHSLQLALHFHEVGAQMRRGLLGEVGGELGVAGRRAARLLVFDEQRQHLAVLDDVAAQANAFVADEAVGPGDQLAHIVLRLAAERAVKRIAFRRLRLGSDRGRFCRLDLGGEDVPIFVAEGLGRELERLAVGDGDAGVGQAGAQRPRHGLGVAKIAHDGKSLAVGERGKSASALPTRSPGQRRKTGVRYASPTLGKGRRRRAVSTRVMRFALRAESCQYRPARDAGMQRMGAADYWDRLADEKTFTHPLNAGWLRAEVRPQDRILDFGCGYGRLVGELAGLGYLNAVGVDRSAAMIGRGRRERPELDLRVVESTVPFADATFDLVLLFAVLTCIVDDVEQEALIAETARLLRAGGLLYVSDMPLQPDARNRARYDAGAAGLGAYGVFETGDGGVLRHHPPERFAALLAGFDILERQTIAVTTMNGNPAAALQVLARRP